MRLKPKSKRLIELEATADSVNLLDFDKPAYLDTIPSMSQIQHSHGSNGLTVISSFSGGGGSTTGFAMSGWKELMASEFVNSARETFAANYPTHIITPQQVHEAAMSWVQENPEAADKIGIVSHKSKTVRGIALPPSLSWEETKDNATDNDCLDVFESMRTDVSRRAFSQCNTDPETIVMWGDDIRGLDPHVAMTHLGLSPGDLDCFNGSPPCKSFSMSGVRSEKWGVIRRYSDERQQRSDDLFYEFARMVEAFMPKTFLAENVQGAAYGKAKAHALEPFINHMSNLGYVVEACIIDAEQCGVPQERKRLFIQGVRKDLVLKDGSAPHPVWPTPQENRYSVEEAFEGLPQTTAQEAAPFWFGSINEFMEHYPQADPGLIKTTRNNDLSDPNEPRFAIGTAWRKLGWGRVPKDTSFQLVRTHPQKAAPTILAQGSSAIAAAGPSHWNEPRKFTIAELKAIASFPQDYVLTGHVEQQGERIGRSVPPLMMKAIADEIATMLHGAQLPKK